MQFMPVFSIDTMIKSSAQDRLTRIELIICLLLSLITLFVYMPVMSYDFINYDDTLYVTENYYVKHGLTIDSIRWAFFSFHASNWHPLTWLSHMLDCQLFGLDPGMHHATNVIFHILNTLLLFFVFFRTTALIWPSVFIAVFFALHPMHVESVAWIAERKDVLSTFFMMITFLFYIDWAKSQNRLKYWAAVVFFAFGLMSKPMLVTLPFLLLLFDYWPLGRSGFDKGNSSNPSESYITTFLIMEKIPFFILSVISSFITVIAQNRGGAMSSLAALPLSERLCNSVVSYSGYITKMIFPFNLSIFYPYSSKSDWVLFFVSLSLLLIVSYIAACFAKKLPWLVVGWLWYLVSLVPVIGIVQVGAQAMADRYSYIPFIGLSLIIVFGVHYSLINWKYSKSFMNAFVLSIALFFLFLTRFQIEKWKDSISIFRHALTVTENNHIAHGNLGDALMKVKRISEAMEHFYKAVKIEPTYATALFNLGVCHMALNEHEKALQNFFSAIRVKPDFAMAYYNVGSIYLKLKEYDKALYYLGRSIALTPDNARGYYKIGLVYEYTGENVRALHSFQKAYNLGYALALTDIDRILKNQEKNLRKP